MFSDLSEKYQKLEEDNKALQEKNTALVTENSSLKKEVANLKEQVEAVNNKLQTMEANFERQWKEEMEKMQEEYKREIGKVKETFCAELKKQPYDEGPREGNLRMMSRIEHKCLCPPPSAKKVKLSESNKATTKSRQMEIEELPPVQQNVSMIQGIVNSPSKNGTSFGIESHPKEGNPFEEFKDPALDKNKIEDAGNKNKISEETMTKADKFYFSAISGKPQFEEATKKGLDLFCASLRQEKDVSERWGPLFNDKAVFSFWKGARLSQSTPTLLSQTCFSCGVEVEDIYKLLCYVLVESDNNKALQIYKKVMKQLQVEKFIDEICQHLERHKNKFKEQTAEL